MATKPIATSGERRPDQTPKAQSRRRSPRYRVQARGDPPADLPDRVSRAHAQAVLLLHTTPVATADSSGGRSRTT